VARGDVLQRIGARSLPLHLDSGAVILGGAGNDYQVATRDLVLAAHHLTDWSDCIDDGCPRRIGHEALQWFQNAGARRLRSKRKQIWLPWLEPSDRGLQYLHQALIRQRNAGGRFLLFICSRPREPQLRRLAGHAERLQVAGSEAFGDENFHVGVHGNVYAATCFLQGLALEEVDRKKLDILDPSFPLILTVRACKRVQT